MMEGIVLKNVVKMCDNGRRAINDVSLVIQAGENIRIVGASGSGKTTLIHLITGMELPSAGSIVVNGENIHEGNEKIRADFRNHTFGFALRNHGFMDALTMSENIAMPLVIRKIHAKKRRLLVMDRMNRLQMEHLAHSYPPQLSMLDLQLANLARAFITSPRILIWNQIDADLTVKEKTSLHNRLQDAGFDAADGGIRIHFTDGFSDDWPYDKCYHLDRGRIRGT